VREITHTTAAVSFRHDPTRLDLRRYQIIGHPDHLKVFALSENEQFRATFIQSVRTAAITVDSTKKKILQNAILNSAIRPTSETIRQIFMQNLDRVTPLHAILLNFL
jgi:hypothetical protein